MLNLLSHSYFALLAETDWVDFTKGMPWFGWIAIVAIVGGALSQTAGAWARHRERMAMIRMGMHPDVPAQESLAMEKPYHPEGAEL